MDSIPPLAVDAFSRPSHSEPRQPPSKELTSSDAAKSNNITNIINNNNINNFIINDPKLVHKTKATPIPQRETQIIH